MWHGNLTVLHKFLILVNLELWPISVDKQDRLSIRGSSKRDRQDLPTSPDYMVPVSVSGGTHTPENNVQMSAVFANGFIG